MVHNFTGCGVPSLTLAGLAIRRLAHQWPLALAQLLGVTAAVTLAASIPLMQSAAAEAGLGQALSAIGAGGSIEIARALVKKPVLLLADEPTAQLDSETGKSVLDVMRDATRSGTAILLATHDQAVIEVADRVLSMEDGQLTDLAPASARP